MSNICVISPQNTVFVVPFIFVITHYELNYFWTFRNVTTSKVICGGNVFWFNALMVCNNTSICINKNNFSNSSRATKPFNLESRNFESYPWDVYCHKERFFKITAGVNNAIYGLFLKQQSQYCKIAVKEIKVVWGRSLFAMVHKESEIKDITNSKTDSSLNIKASYLVIFNI